MNSLGFYVDPLIPLNWIFKYAITKGLIINDYEAFAEAGELEPFSFNSVYQLVLHLSELLSVAFL